MKLVRDIEHSTEILIVVIATNHSHTYIENQYKVTASEILTLMSACVAISSSIHFLGVDCRAEFNLVTSARIKYLQVKDNPVILWPIHKR